MYLYVSLLGHSQPEFLATPVCLLLRPLQCQPITCFVPYYLFQDDDRIKRLILTYPEKNFAKNFQDKEFIAKITSSNVGSVSDQAGSGSNSEIAASTFLMKFWFVYFRVWCFADL